MPRGKQMPSAGDWIRQQLGVGAGQPASFAHSTNWVPLEHCAIGAQVVLRVLIDTQHTCAEGQGVASTHAALDPPTHAAGLLAGTQVWVV